MIKSLLCLLTLNALLYIPPKQWINISLIDPPTVVVLPHSSACQHAEHAVAFGAAMGKVIKEKHFSDKAYEIKTVVLDPGHGGKDPGCSGKYSQEKHIALAIAKRLSEQLKINYPNLNVILTRETDTFIPLAARAATANKNNADLFISIHCNAIARYYGTMGSETYVLGLHRAEDNLEVAKRENAAILYEEDYEKTYDGFDPNSDEGHIILSMYQNAHLEQSILLGSMIENRIHSEADRKSRGVKQAGFLVLRETTMPSVLVETGFLTNRSEENYLRTKTGQSEIANAIFRAFEDYKTVVEGGGFENALPVDLLESAMPERAESIVESQIESTKAKQTVRPISTAYEQKPTPQIELEKEQTTWSYATNNDLEEQFELTNKSIQKSETETIEFQTKNSASRSSTNESANHSTLPIQYRVQLAASDVRLKMNDPKWHDIPYVVEIIWENNLHKYQIRNLSNFQQADKIRVEMMHRGFLRAFVVAYQGNKRISVKEANKKVGHVGM